MAIDKQKGLWILVALVLILFLSTPSSKKEGVSFSSDTLSECNAKLNDKMSDGKEICTPCLLYTSELASCYDSDGSRDDKIDNTYIFGYSSECDSSLSAKRLKDCVDQLDLDEPDTFKVTILKEFDLIGTGDIEITSNSANFNNDLVRFFIYVKNNGDSTETFLIELQPQVTSGLKLATIRKNAVCDENCKENVHTLVSLGPGATQQISITLPKMKNGIYDILAKSFSSCCSDNPDCEPVSPVYGSGQLIAQIKVENSDVSETCSTPFCGDGNCNGQETEASCNIDCKTDNNVCTSGTILCADGTCKADCNTGNGDDDGGDNGDDGDDDTDDDTDSENPLMKEYGGLALWLWLVIGFGFLFLMSIMKKR